MDKENRFSLKVHIGLKFALRVFDSKIIVLC